MGKIYDAVHSERKRCILHCDLNSFYASVEIRNRPKLQGKAVAVCGSQAERSGIVLAKSEKAKKCGVLTGETIWQAQQKCPELIIIEPHFEQYLEVSAEVKEIYSGYTDRVEPFGIDECWLDVSGSTLLFGSGYEIADEIRRTVKKETGVTISAGVSFNKVFAKLGSDMKKPDAVTVIPREDFKEKIWSLPASDMIGVGRATSRKLAGYGIITIGQLASCDPEFLRLVFGKCGVDIWRYANGEDISEVAKTGYIPPIKSIGHGNTARRDLCGNDEVRLMMIELSQDIAERMRKNGLEAKGVQIAVKDKDLQIQEYQAPLPYPTQVMQDIASAAYKLFLKNYNWAKPVRALTVRAISLSPVDECCQMDMFENVRKRERSRRLEFSVDRIRERYGKDAISIAALSLPGLPFGSGGSKLDFDSMHNTFGRMNV
ncbi:MAG: DNA polymerase IV [Clostridia bacterium]|nr:DNA polymerase IV [Clostridia bacterium]